MNAINWEPRNLRIGRRQLAVCLNLWMGPESSWLMIVSFDDSAVDVCRLAMDSRVGITI